MVLHSAELLEQNGLSAALEDAVIQRHAGLLVRFGQLLMVCVCIPDSDAESPVILSWWQQFLPQVPFHLFIQSPFPGHYDRLAASCLHAVKKLLRAAAFDASLFPVEILLRFHNHTGKICGSIQHSHILKVLAGPPVSLFPAGQKIPECIIVHIVI